MGQVPWQSWSVCRCYQCRELPASVVPSFSFLYYFDCKVVYANHCSKALCYLDFDVNKNFNGRN